MSAIDYGTYRSRAVSANSRVRFAVVDAGAQDLSGSEVRELNALKASGDAVQTTTLPGASRINSAHLESNQNFSASVHRSLVRPDRPQSRSGVAFGVVATPMSALSPETDSYIVKPARDHASVNIVNKSVSERGRAGVFLAGEKAAKNNIVARSAVVSSRSYRSTSVVSANVVAAEAQIISAIKLLAILIVMMAMFAIGVSVAGTVFTNGDVAAADVVLDNSINIVENLPSLIRNS
ncbi:MAG: hypothetical protein SPG61_02615 [Arcanobacterium sp.]|nr:hypothetical protein [Arcanobacterium sp.]